MKNLHLNSHITNRFKDKGVDFDVFNESFQFSVSSVGSKFFYGDGNILINGHEFGCEQVSIKEELLQENITDCRVVGLQVTSEGTAVLATKSGGALVAVGAEGVSIVGQVDAGLVAISQSPDEELFLVITEASTIILMTRDFDPLNEIPLDPSDPDFRGEKALISVGWGSKETQFHGKAGKSAAKTAPPPQSPIGPHDDRKVRVVWKEDGEQFAVSYISTTQDGVEVRRIRIFNREGILQSTSEDVPGLEHALAWKPSGALLASSVSLPNKHQIQFFEKNGLRHGEFVLPFAVGEVTIRELAWNVDSSVLMVLATEIRSPGVDYLQLWTCSNYKWSLKKSWKMTTGVLAVQWDPTSSLKLHFVTADGLHHECDFTQTVDHSYGTTDSDLAFVANIDGKVVGLTPFRQTVIPPPMSAFELRFNHNVSQVMFGSSVSRCDPNNLLVLTENRDLFVFGLPEANQTDLQECVQVTGAGGKGFLVKCDVLKPHQKYELLSTVDHTNFCWLTPGKLLASRNSPRAELVVFSRDSIELCYVETCVIPCEEPIFSITPSPCGTIAAVQLISGSVLKFRDEIDVDGFELQPWMTQDEAPIQFPTVCTEVKIALRNNRHLLFSLSSRNRLYCEGLEIATGINSFFLHSTFLLATTLQHTLKAVPLRENLFEEKRFDSKIWELESVRAVERGSRLVVAVPEHSQVVLQMPRGNLEVVHPRALSIHIIQKLLDDCKYAKAMDIFRRQRINLNLIVDHNPSLFLNHIENFIEQTADKQRLCLFIADLRDEDTTTTMYKSMYADCKTYVWKDSTKVDTVCRKMETVLQQNLEENFLPIISCLVKYSTSKNETALLKIQEMKDKNSRLADDALNYLLLLVDVQVLFDAALGLYDFDLVLFVAQKSQKDPKEYLQFLNELKRFPVNYRKFKIDQHLKRFQRALEHLVACGEPYLEECLNFIREHRMYSKALCLFNPGSTGFKDVCLIYGEYLSSKKYYEDSAIIFEKGGLLSEALVAWENGLRPAECLSVAKNLNLAPNETAALCRRLAARLVDSRRYSDAAKIFLEYLEDPEEAIATLVAGQSWAEAKRSIVKYSRLDLMETHFLPKLKESGEHILSIVDSHRESFGRYVDRFTVVLETKAKIASGLFEEVDVNIDDADLYSDITGFTQRTGSVSQRLKSNPASIQTRASSQRSKSSKNRRKHERKKYSTKEGSTFEDIGLVAALHELITKVYALSGEVGHLTRALLLHNQETLARNLQSNYSTLLDEIFAKESTIWTESAVRPDQDEVVFGPEATTADIIQQNTKSKDVSPPYHLLEIHLRYPPPRTISDNWKLIILDN